MDEQLLIHFLSNPSTFIPTVPIIITAPIFEKARGPLTFSSLYILMTDKTLENLNLTLTKE